MTNTVIGRFYEFGTPFIQQSLGNCPLLIRKNVGFHREDLIGRIVVFELIAHEYLMTAVGGIKDVNRTKHV
jgi:hypothetical protein